MSKPNSPSSNVGQPLSGVAVTPTQQKGTAK